MSTEYCSRCGARGAPTSRDAFDARFCWRCFDGEADAERAAEIIAAAEDRWDARRMLGDIADPRALPALLAGLDHSSTDVRRGVLSAIGLVGDPAATSSVVALLEDPDRRTREATVQVLGDLGGPDALDALADLLDDEELGTLVAVALAWHRDGRAFDTLISSDANPLAMRNAARTPMVALSWLNDPRAVPVLLDRLAGLQSEYVASEPPQKWVFRERAQEISRVLAFFGGDDAIAAVDRARSVFRHFNTAMPLDFVPVPPRFPTLADELADARRTVPKWSLELVEVDEPIVEPVTKFGGQPVWIDEPAWPLTKDGTPMTFFAQVVVPDSDGKLAYLFIDPEDELNGTLGSNANAVFAQPGGAPARYVQQPTGPRYVSSRFDMSRFQPRLRFGFVERRPLLTGGRDPLDWTPFVEEGTATESDWNKVAGTPLWLQGPDAPNGDGWRFLFQFSAEAIGHEFGDGAVCYGFVSDDGGGAFTWQCH